jgi:surface polysaccharide O-acyltransferase-like enzyme
LLLALPLAAIEAVLRPRWPGFQNLYNDWANFYLYLLYFIYGYLLSSDARFVQAIDRHLRIALVLAVTSMLALLACGRLTACQSEATRWYTSCTNCCAGLTPGSGSLLL